jgi:sigma-B regulation protein RsbU (phosphoserine phosphatase)
MRILIAEDDRATARMLSSLIASWGFEVATVGDGRSALEAFDREAGPQLVLLDWMLPAIDGLEICRRIRASDQGAPTPYIILLTSRNGPTDLVAGLDAGADEYLVKPIDPDELRARLNAGARIISLQQVLEHKIRELEAALRNNRMLTGLLPICAYCKSIRDDSNYWHRVEEYVTEHSDAQFSHGICPNCLPKVEKDMAAEGL